MPQMTRVQIARLLRQSADLVEQGGVISDLRIHVKDEKRAVRTFMYRGARVEQDRTVTLIMTAPMPVWETDFDPFQLRDTALPAPHKTGRVSGAIAHESSVAKPKRWDIWVEGYAATGQYGTAQMLAAGIEAATFKEACIKVCSPKAFQEGHGDFDAERLTVWSCKLFDNEAGARRSYG